MGYSCTKDAADTLAVIGKMFATDGNPNVLTIRGKHYFFERGRENEDGSITGKLMEMLPGDFCQEVGKVKINADGSVFRFARLKVEEMCEAMDTARDMQARNPQLLRQWGYGTI
jgi:hypothetical protein